MLAAEPRAGWVELVESSDSRSVAGLFCGRWEMVVVGMVVMRRKVRLTRRVEQEGSLGEQCWKFCCVLPDIVRRLPWVSGVDQTSFLVVE